MLQIKDYKSAVDICNYSDRQFSVYVKERKIMNENVQFTLLQNTCMMKSKTFSAKIALDILNKKTI